MCNAGIGRYCPDSRLYNHSEAAYYYKMMGLRQVSIAELLVSLVRVFAYRI
jgi:hypothetical protein